MTIKKPVSARWMDDYFHHSANKMLYLNLIIYALSFNFIIP